MLSRTTSRVGSMTASGCRRPSRRRSASDGRAALPATSWSTVVSGGRLAQRAAVVEADDREVGRARPGRATRRRGSSPSAKASEKQSTAVGRSGPVQQRRGRRPTAAVAGRYGVIDDRRLDAGGVERVVPAEHPLAGGVVGRRPPAVLEGDDADRRWPRSTRCWAASAGAAPVVDVDLGDALALVWSTTTIGRPRRSSQARSGEVGSQT